MSIISEAELADLRVIAESQMVDACTIRHRTGETTDPDTGAVTYTYGNPFYDGPCNIVMPTGDASDVHVLAQELSTQSRITVCLPADSPPAVADDRMDLTSVRDAALTGRELRIESFIGQTWSVERRYSCEESTTPDA